MKIDLLCYYNKESQLCCTNQRNEVKTQNWQVSNQKLYEINTGKMATGSRSYGLYRPRSGLARAIYEKHNNDRYLEEFDQNEVSLLDLNINDR